MDNCKASAIAPTLEKQQKWPKNAIDRPGGKSEVQ
jgi:hypothetical protein